MTRGLDSSAQTEAAKPLNSLITLVDILVDPSDPAYITDYARDITVDSKNYLSAQGLLQFGAVIEDAQNSIQKVDISLTGIPDEFVNLFLDYDYIDRPLQIRKQFINHDTDALVGSSFLVFDGRIDKPVINHQFNAGTATISVTSSSHWVDYNRKNGRHTNDSEQQSHFSGDDCFEYAIDFDKEISWGQT